MNAIFSKQKQRRKQMRKSSSWWRGAVLTAVLLMSCAPRPAPITEPPLKSWNDTASKRAIVDFVRNVTTEGSPEFVPASERIAVFDNDGTLWSEKPVPF